MLMNDDFREGMRQAIDSAPDARVARQLETLLGRLEGTGGAINPDMPLPFRPTVEDKS
jgi:hypothetical protein